MTDSQYQEIGKDYLEHHGIKGMRWGVRHKKQDDSLEKQKLQIKRNIAIGAAAIATGLVLYGGYKYTKFIKDENVRLAMKKGFQIADGMRRSDIRMGEKFPGLKVNYNKAHYYSIGKEYGDKARKDKFSIAYSNVKKVREAEKRAEALKKRTIKRAKREIKMLHKGEVRFVDFSAANNWVQRFSPDVLKELNVSVKDGHIYSKGKKIY